MGKEEDPNGVFPYFSGHLSGTRVNTKVGEHVGWMGAAPRTPLRTLIARESSSFRTTTVSQPTDPKSSPGRKRGEAGSAHGSGRWNSSLDGSKSGRRTGSFLVKGESPGSPPSGCSSPSTTFGTRYKMRMLQKAATAAAMPPKPTAELRSAVQLGALFAQEREETRSSRMADVAEPDGAILVKNVQPPLRDLIAAELAPPGRKSFRSPSPGNYSNGGNVTKPPEVAPDTTQSQELRYLFAKDWALQASDEDDEDFWDSGSLCGASPSPRLGRRRTKKQLNSKSTKLRHSSSSHSTPGLQQHSRVNSPFTTPASIASRLQELRVLQSSPAHGLSCRLPSEDVECGPKSSSLGTLLAEEIAATSRNASSLESVSVIVEPTWSAPVGSSSSDSSRRPKIGSLSDISAPVRPESKSQLDFLIAKILTLRANSMESKSTLAGERDDGGCSTSGSKQRATADMVRVREEDFFSGATPAATDVNLSTVDAPNTTLQVMNLPSPEAPNSSASTQEEPPLGESIGETRHNSSSTVTDAGAGAGAGEATTSRHEVNDAESSNEGEPSEVEAPAPERVQLGSLLERTRGEHGWLPLGRSRMGSPLGAVPAIPLSESENSDSGIGGNAQIASQPPAGSGTSSSQFNTFATETCHHSEIVLPPRSSPGSPRSPELVGDNHLTFQQPPETTTTMELASSNSPPVVATPMRDRPATQRVSLLSLLNQDTEMEHEDGLHSSLEVLCGGNGEEDGDEEEQAEAEELDPMCCVCMVGHKGAAFIPCGHTFCRKCCREVRRSLGSCPLCNQAIVDVLKLY